ncbi:MAG: DUF87 domain-containing protein [Candidatus Thorarchaeota archaeon]|nr:DUF87 domain-containing protein [Candidatus Thorarchaeota archaeon]
MDVKFLKCIRIAWPSSTAFSIFYFVMAYVLPITGVAPPLAVPMRALVEGLLLLFPPITGGIVIGSKIKSQKISMLIENDILVVQLDRSIVATCVLQLNSVTGSVKINENGEHKYVVSALLALREGMDDYTSMAYEVGTINQEPFIRLFITARGDSVTSLRQQLQIESTRCEAILRSTLNTVEVERLREGELREAIETMREPNLETRRQEKTSRDGTHRKIIVVAGNPSINPNEEATQIGTFLVGLLRQGYNASLTCAFKPANPGREKRALEKHWKKIRRKEREKRESLSDHAMKERLLEEYKEIGDVDAWFEASIYVTIQANSQIELRLAEEGVRGLLISIWGEKGNLSLESVKLGGRNGYRVLNRRPVKSSKIHLERLVGYFNTPSQQLPVVTGKAVPFFSIPEKETINNELVIGRAVFNSRCLSEVGLKKDWLREHIAVMGATGTGKTTLVKRLIAELSAKTEIPWLVFDVKGSEYSDLREVGFGSVDVLIPGAENNFVLNLFAPEGDSPERHAHITFAIIRELLNERGVSAELSPAMERLLRESVEKVVLEEEEKTVASLERMIFAAGTKGHISEMTRDALLNRLQILFREPLATVFGPGKKTLEISTLLDERVIVDLSYVARIGGMDAARLLYNVIVKRVFDSAMQRGITEGLRHIVVLEEAYNLVPESYTRSSAADVTTGESMVMLQRATGQGVVVVSTRPNISSNILANTSTKITFRLPYDSGVARRYLSLDDRQEEYLQSLTVGNALIKLPDVSVFEIKTLMPEYGLEESTSHIRNRVDEEIIEGVECNDTPMMVSHDGEERVCVERGRTSKGREHVIGEISGLVTGYLASRDFVTKEQLEELLVNLNYDHIDMTREQLIEELISLSIIQREAIPVVKGGFVFSVPGNANESIEAAISQYILEKSDEIRRFEDDGSETTPNFIVGSNAILIVPERIRIPSIETIINVIKESMKKMGNTIEELYVIVRGSIAAAKVRERIEKIDGFDLVTIVPAFQSSIDRMLSTCTGSQIGEKEPKEKSHEIESALEQFNGATKKSGTSVGRRIWFGLLREFLSVSGGAIEWGDFLSFISTTAIQSKRARSIPLEKGEGMRILSQMIETGECHLFRLSKESNLHNLEPGLWVLGAKKFQSIKLIALEAIVQELKRRGREIVSDHYPFDFCVGDKSYAVLPGKNRMKRISNSISETACDECQTHEVVCILGDSSIIEDDDAIPDNVAIRYWKEGISSNLGSLFMVE